MNNSYENLIKKFSKVIKIIFFSFRLDMHECPEKDKEVARLKEVQEKLKKYVGVAAENRKKYNITGV